MKHDPRMIVPVHAPNSLIFLADEQSRSVPDSFIRPIVAMSDALVIGTLMSQDGPTTIRVVSGLGGSARISDPALTVIFDGLIETPSGALVLINVNLERYLRVPLATTSARVRVATNHPDEPDIIDILIQEETVSRCRPLQVT
jgi:hypothetical protein